MKIYVSFDGNRTLKAFLSDKLKALDFNCKLNGINEIELDDNLSSEKQNELFNALNHYHIEVIEDKKIAIIERIKNSIDEMLNNEDAQLINSSDFLADKLNYSYTYLSTLFSEATYTSIENYIILRKVDKVKSLLLKTDLTLTEIAFKLNYSSVAHLSGQFKKTTGLTPSTFQRIIAKRKLTQQNNL
ncbi:hypothetical protein GCM10022291_07670 [Postechiella marina]|uniref:HTH araC/xylS-type domain-containing protein n=1 Tax=Postechiella marina TaxID=943941 RepID=A0ABP8C3L0_9FLAO